MGASIHARLKISRGWAYNPEQPEMYRIGRRRGTREMVVHPNYIVIYRVLKKAGVVEILRIMHAAQKWP